MVRLAGFPVTPRQARCSSPLVGRALVDTVLKGTAMERINWHPTELNTPVPGMATGTAAIADGPVKWGTSSVGTFVISCDSGLPEGQLRTGRDYAVVLHIFPARAAGFVS